MHKVTISFPSLEDAEFFTYLARKSAENHLRLTGGPAGIMQDALTRAAAVVGPGDANPFLVAVASSVPPRTDAVPDDHLPPLVPNWWHLECQFSWGWERSGSYDRSYPTRAEALSVLKTIKSGLKYRVCRSK
jgi:hypothetical protein